MTVFTKRLEKGFQNLRLRGYFAEQNWQCCQGCGCAALPDGTKNYAFYHQQDAEGITAKNQEVYIAWGGDGEEIRKAFLEAELAVTWNGEHHSRLLVSMPPTH